MKISVHPFSNGSKYGWSKLHSLFDFFFPYAKNGKYHYIRQEATTSADSIYGITSRDFFTFRAFAWHYIYTLLINPLKELQLFFLQYNQIRYELLTFLAIQNPKFIPLLALPIAFDAAASGSVLPGTSLTYSQTCTGNNLLLFTSVDTGNQQGATDVITGITYATVSLTRVNTASDGTNRRNYLYQLIAPATGANDVVVSISPSTDTRSTTSSYTGAQQSGVPDASGTTSSGAATSLTVTITTIADNCWTVSTSDSNQGTPTAGAGVTLRGTSQNGPLGDSNAVITPAGSTSMTWNFPASGTCAMCMASFAPAVAAAAAGGYTFIISWIGFLFMILPILSLI